jgi:hypothetical protein
MALAERPRVGVSVTTSNDPATKNLEEAIRARKEQRKPVYQD